MTINKPFLILSVELEKFEIRQNNVSDVKVVRKYLKIDFIGILRNMIMSNMKINKHIVAIIYSSLSKIKPKTKDNKNNKNFNYFMRLLI